MDGVDLGRNDHVMQTDDVIHLHRIDPARNMARFYRMSSTPSLFGDICLVREWGRIGRPGRIRIDLFQTGEEAMAAGEALSRVKRQRGYHDTSGME
ncbi:MAG: WGR domain-containing protein [Pseudomonadota bacterium]